MGVGVRDAFPPPMCCVGSCIHSFAYGNAAARTFGRAHRHRPYGFVWADYAWTVNAVLGIARGWFGLFVGENGAHEPTPSVLYFW